ncbi:MAG: 3,4-dihydroxy-2-butanone-4-phosphate synthase, partial [Bacteroidota bacterium]
MADIKIDSIESAIEDIRNGKMVIVVDDADRENEGDLIVAMRHVTPEVVNFMARYARGLLCASLLEEDCERLKLELMVGKNTSSHETPFTVSVDYLKDGVTTGISVSDRSKTLRALIDPDAKPEDFGRPGHIFPLKAKTEGVLRRAGHTEATVDLARLAGCEPAGALIEIMNEDGSMARLPELRVFADEHDLKLISIADLIEYRLKHDSLV